MSQLMKVQYQKPEAIFANNDQAISSMREAIPTEMRTISQSSNAQLLEQGILLSPIYFEWNQETFTLTVNKLVSSAIEYRAGRAADSLLDTAAMQESISAAGWTYIGTIVEDQL